MTNSTTTSPTYGCSNPLNHSNHIHPYNHSNQSIHIQNLNYSQVNCTTPISQMLPHSDFSPLSVMDNYTVGEYCSNKKEFPSADEVIDKSPKENGYTAYLNPKPPDDLKCSVLSYLLTELIPVEVTKSAKMLSPETERVLQRHTSPLVNELVHHSQFWDFRHGFQKIQTNICEVDTSNKFFDSGNQVIEERGEETLRGLLAVNQRNMDEVVKVQDEQCENVFNDGWVSKLKALDPMPGSETAASEVLCDGEVVGEVEYSSSQRWGSEVTAHDGVSDQEMDKIREGSNQLQGFGTAKKSESLQDVPITIENEAASIDLKFKEEQMESEEQIESQRVTVGEGAGKEVDRCSTHYKKFGNHD